VEGSRFESGGGLLTIDLQREFIWRDGERTIVFRTGALGSAQQLLTDYGWARFELLASGRGLAAAPADLRERAAATTEVRAGPVDEAAAELVDRTAESSLVARGGGRVIDVAKAVAAVRGGRVAAIPTTLSGAPMTPFHRLPAGHTAQRLVRPELVVADPDAMTSQPEAAMRASAMNALAHGAEALYGPLANPVATMAALRGARLIAESLDQPRPNRDRAALALGAMLCAYAVGSALFALHHVVCQSLVRVLGIPHAETNATMLPRTVDAMRDRAPEQIGALAGALGTSTESIAARIEELGGGPRRLSDLGADPSRLDEALDAIMARGELQATPDPPTPDQLRALIESAWSPAPTSNSRHARV
jgi:alcohol dehydrogenase class IV